MQLELPAKFFSNSPTMRFACPNCKKGKLAPVEKSFRTLEPPHSKDAYGHEAWDPDWIEYRFNFECKCNLATCQEVAFVSGTGFVDQMYVDDEIEYFDHFQIRSVVPAPPLIDIPSKTPYAVRRPLEKSFELYWIDNSAASNALRASLEAVLDELKVPRTKKNKSGGTSFISLHERIEKASTSLPDFKELFLALKDVGNHGSHGEEVHSEFYSDALEIYSHVIKQLYENDAAEMKALAKKLREKIKNSKKHI